MSTASTSFLTGTPAAVSVVVRRRQGAHSLPVCAAAKKPAGPKRAGRPAAPDASDDDSNSLGRRAASALPAVLFLGGLVYKALNTAQEAGNGEVKKIKPRDFSKPKPVSP